MATKLKNQSLINTCLTIASSLVNLQMEHIWIDYDKEADVLYLSFRKPQKATKTIETDEGILLRKDKNAIVGITILDASHR